MVAYVRDVQSSLGRPFQFFIHARQEMEKLCPQGEGQYRFGRIESDAILAYQDEQGRRSLPARIQEALLEW